MRHIFIVTGGSDSGCDWFGWLVFRKPQVFRIYNRISVPFETMGKRVNSSRDVVALWGGMSGNCRDFRCLDFRWHHRLRRNMGGRTQKHFMLRGMTYSPAESLIHQQPISGKSQMTLLCAIWEVNRPNLCISILGSESWSLLICNTSFLVSISGLNHHFPSLFGCLSTLCTHVWITTTIHLCSGNHYIWTKFCNVHVVTRINSNVKLFDHYLVAIAIAYHRERKIIPSYS